MSLGRGFLFRPRVGLVSMWPRAIAWFMICRNTSSAEFAPPGARRAVTFEPSGNAGSVDPVERHGAKKRADS